jgi:hypothetical protein
MWFAPLQTWSVLDDLVGSGYSVINIDMLR